MGRVREERWKRRRLRMVDSKERGIKEKSKEEEESKEGNCDE